MGEEIKDKLEPGHPEPEVKPGELDLEPEPEVDPEHLDPELEPDTEPEPPESEPETENMVPQSRVDKITAEKHEFKTKLDQFKRLGPEEYYKLYPDEAPEPEPKPAKPTDTVDADIGNMTVQGGPYDGLTVNEVLERDQAYGIAVLNRYYEDQRQAQAVKTQSEAEAKASAEADLSSFKNSMASQIFEKDGFDKVTPEEETKISELVNTVMDWMEEKQYWNVSMSDAYYLMNRDGELDKAKKDTLKGIVDSLKQPGTPSIESKATPSTTGGYDRFLGMTAEQVKDEMEAWTEAQEDEFYQKASKSVREKFSHLPWPERKPA